MSLFAGATAVHSIFSNGATLNLKLNALAFWAGSFTMLLVTYDAIMVATMVTLARPNVTDVIIPFVVGLLEFLQFTVLTIQAGSVASPEWDAAQLSQIAWWPLVAALAGAAASAICFNHRRQLEVSVKHASPELDEAYRWYQQNLRKDQAVTATATTFMLLAFVVLRWGLPDLRPWQGVVGVMMSLGAAGSLRNTELARRKFTEAFVPFADGEPPPVSDPPA